MPACAFGRLSPCLGWVNTTRNWPFCQRIIAAAAVQISFFFSMKRNNTAAKSSPRGIAVYPAAFSIFARGEWISSVRQSFSRQSSVTTGSRENISNRLEITRLINWHFMQTARACQRLRWIMIGYGTRHLPDSII